MSKDRYGERHPRAKLTDAEVEIIRRIYEEGMVGYRALAQAFAVNRDTIARICRYERRAYPSGYIDPVDMP